jgi:AcrR family transcriptional regulator
MILPAKQQRSLDRINKILDTAELILEHEPLSALSIAKISVAAELKRTSTYKFFETSDDIKLALIQRYVEACNEALIKDLQINVGADYSGCLKHCVNSIIGFFEVRPGAQKLILENTVSPAVTSSDLHKIAATILKSVEGSIGLPNMFNKPGVFLVITQIIFSILSLNTKENGELTDVGVNEAVRATNAYLLSCLATPA